MSRYFLSSFRPLNNNKRGRNAVETFGLLPYIDCSCRREPDFESKYPSISAICHAGKFAPRLREDDTIIFITVKNKYPPQNFNHWRLVSILKVLLRFESHEEAKNWYLSKNLPLPSNCMVDGNEPLPLEMTTGPREYSRLKNLNPSQIVKIWDNIYWKGVKEHSTFLVCEPIFVELSHPPVLNEDTMTKIFGKIPGTLNPPQISKDQFEKIQEIAKKKQ